jgi:hypothetical protein
VAVTLEVVSAASLAWLRFAGIRPPPPYTLPRPWLEGWYRWDGGWYARIARTGYTYAGPHRSSAVAFFPGYPLAMRVIGGVVGDPVLGGILITFCAGALSAVLFVRWARPLLGEPAARWGLVALLVYPFAFYLVGAVYSDALYLAAALAAFTLLEEGHPGWAGVIGIIATATRPVGLALTIGLVVRAVERSRPHGGVTGRPALASRWRAVAAVTISTLGAAAYTTLLWIDFREPFAFARVADAPGWDHRLAWATILKRDALHLITHPAFDVDHTRVMLQTATTLVAVALVPLVVRRLGWGYGIYCLLTVGVPAASAPAFIGLGRYILAAFPCFAVAGLTLSQPGRRPLGLTVLVTSGLILVALTSFFARGAYLS